jgi:manganese transport protein
MRPSADPVPGGPAGGRPRRRLRLGPGALVAAAFIGPGTVTTCSLAGARFGPGLLWALTFSILATLVLQEMSLRMGVVAGRGLAEALREDIPSPIIRRTASLLVLTAVTFGCAAYETGNLLGAGLGLEALGIGGTRLLAPLTGVAAGLLLWWGSYRMLERVLVGTVILMSLAFLGTLAMTGLDMAAVVRGALLPRLEPGGLYLALALVGTTVVPYNLFLHAAAVQERFQGAADLGAARLDAGVTIGLGGVVSGAIVLTAAAAFYHPGGGVGEPASAADLARQLEPLLGRTATLCFSVGLLAAGVSSALTAPMAAAYATQGVLGWKGGLTGRGQRGVALAVVATGVLFGALGVPPLPAITLAQAANGILLPLVAGFLLWAANDRRRLGEHANGLGANLAGGLTVLIAAALGLWALFKLIG